MSEPTDRAGLTNDPEVLLPRVQRWFASELSRAQGDLERGLLARPSRRHQGSTASRRRIVWGSVLSGGLVAVVVVAFAGGLLGGSPSPTPSVASNQPSQGSLPSVVPSSPARGTVIGANGLPRSIDDEPVLDVADAIVRASVSTDASSFLVGGWLYGTKAACPIPVPRTPALLNTGLCGGGPALIAVPPYGPTGQPGVTLDNTSVLWTVFLRGVSPPEPQRPVGVLNLALVLRVHTHDPSASTCPSTLREQCDSAVVVSAVLWQAAIPTPEPSQPSSKPTSRPGFRPTGSMSVFRDIHTATLLPDGQVLVAGGGYSVSAGFDALAEVVLDSAELYDPATGRFSPTGSMETPRLEQTATLLPSGLVLIAGGWDDTVTLGSAELYDPATGTFSATGSLSVARSGATATLLADGLVLIAGGIGSNRFGVTSAELYDPANGTFSATGAMASVRTGATATLLPDGQVLIAGGQVPGSDTGSGILASAELYDPATGTFRSTGAMTTSRVGFTATLLDDGQVLVTGGATAAESSRSLATAELYNPATGTFALTGPMSVHRVRQTATLLPDGRVLVAGGDDTLISGPPDSADIYDPGTGTFTRTGPMTDAPRGHTATLLLDGSVLIAGGNGGGKSAQVYQP